MWFDGNAKEAANFYCTVFKDAVITAENAIVVMFETNKQKFMCLNGGPMYKFNEAVSFVVNCETQAEIDYYWDYFTKNGGQESMCGWCKDKFGVSWQIVPTILGELMVDPQKQQKVIDVFLQMKKFDIEKLINANDKIIK